MSSRPLNERIKAEAVNLGFFACGIAKAERIEEPEASLFTRWISRKGYAEMGYMSNYTDKRLDPRLLMPGVKSIVCVAMNYAPEHKLPENELQLASYALGQDYHDILKNRLHALAKALGIENYRAFCDTAPVLERYWAMKSGIGWIGRNHQLIIPHAGSMFFLGELFIDIETDYDKPVTPRCGTCHACIDACPTKALGTWKDGKAHGDGSESAGSYFDAARCLSYQTIENRGEIPRSIADKMGNVIYGCDRCQAACPWNKFAKPTSESALMPKDELISMTREKWEHLTVDGYRRLFKGSAVKRAKYEGLMRNIKTVLDMEKNNNEDNEKNQ